MSGQNPADAAVVCELAELLDEAGLTLVELSERTGITTVNLSILKNNRARAIRFTTLVAICDAVGCQPGDLLRVTRAESSASP